MEDNGIYINIAEDIIVENFFPLVCNNVYKLLWETNWTQKLYMQPKFKLKATDFIRKVKIQ